MIYTVNLFVCINIINLSYAFDNTHFRVCYLFFSSSSLSFDSTRLTRRLHFRRHMMSSFWYNGFQKEKFRIKKNHLCVFFICRWKSLDILWKRFPPVLSISHFSFINDDVSRQFLMLFSLSLSALSNFFAGHNVLVVPYADDIIHARAAINYTATYDILYNNSTFSWLCFGFLLFCSFELSLFFKPFLSSLVALLPPRIGKCAHFRLHKR